MDDILTNLINDIILLDNPDPRYRVLGYIFWISIGWIIGSISKKVKGRK